MSRHDEDILQGRLSAERTKQLVPSAYVKRHDNRYWIFLCTPSGAVVRLLSSYESQGTGEQAVQFFGFTLIAEPVTATLTRANTTPR